MKALWLNDALTIRPDDDEERSTLAAILVLMEKGGMAPEEAPSTGYASEADRVGGRVCASSVSSRK